MKVFPTSTREGISLGAAWCNSFWDTYLHKSRFVPPNNRFRILSSIVSLMTSLVEEKGLALILDSRRMLTDVEIDMNMFKIPIDGVASGWLWCYNIVRIWQQLNKCGLGGIIV